MIQKNKNKMNIMKSGRDILLCEVTVRTFSCIDRIWHLRPLIEPSCSVLQSSGKSNQYDHH